MDLGLQCRAKSASAVAWLLVFPLRGRVAVSQRQQNRTIDEQIYGLTIGLGTKQPLIMPQQVPGDGSAAPRGGKVVGFRPAPEIGVALPRSSSRGCRSHGTTGVLRPRASEDDAWGSRSTTGGRRARCPEPQVRPERRGSGKTRCSSPAARRTGRSPLRGATCDPGACETSIGFPGAWLRNRFDYRSSSTVASLQVGTRTGTSSASPHHGFGFTLTAPGTIARPGQFCDLVQADQESTSGPGTATPARTGSAIVARHE